MQGHPQQSILTAGRGNFIDRDRDIPLAGCWIDASDAFAGPLSHPKFRRAPK